MTADELGVILAEDAIATGSTALIDAKLRAARAALMNGGTVSVLTSASINGKSFQREHAMGAAEVMSACRYALRIVAGDGEDDTAISSTLPDFRHLIH